MKSGLTIVTDKTAALREALKKLTSQEVLVGIPEAKAAREGEMNNATLGYIHDKGSPAQNIPARPFMEPGIAKKRDDIVAELRAAGEAALDMQPGKIDQRLQRVGLIAQAGIRSMFGGGEMAPLKPETIASRTNAKGRAKNQKKMGDGGAAAVPLIDTGQLRNSISYVVRKK